MREVEDGVAEVTTASRGCGGKGKEFCKNKKMKTGERKS